LLQNESLEGGTGGNVRPWETREIPAIFRLNTGAKLPVAPTSADLNLILQQPLGFPFIVRLCLEAQCPVWICLPAVPGE